MSGALSSLPAACWFALTTVSVVAEQLLGENTLTIADTLVLAPDEHGNLALMFRYGSLLLLFR